MQSLNKQSTNSKKHARKRLVVGVIIAILVLVAGVAVYALFYKNNSQSVNQTGGTEKQGVDTRDSTSEGETFPVPDDVPADAIKDYSLVTENEQFKIRHDGASNSYLITLYPLVNNPSQQATYHDQLREYKRNALDYLKNQGKDITKLEIKYEPAEAAQL